jgi:hypothetical protein
MRARRTYPRIKPVRTRRAKYEIAVADGLVRAVLEGMEWARANPVVKKHVGRWEFDALPAVTRAEWIGRNVVGSFAHGAQNLIRYVDC